MFTVSILNAIENKAYLRTSFWDDPSICEEETGREKKLTKYSKTFHSQREDSGPENCKLSFLPEDGRIPAPSSNIIADHSHSHTKS